MGTTTGILGLYKPDVGEVSWGTLRVANEDVVDIALGTQHELSGAHKFITVTDASGYVQLPSLTTGERTALPAVNGMMVYNSSLGYIESYESGVWSPIALGNSQFTDAAFRIYDDAAPTSLIAFSADSITPGNTRTITMPDTDVDLGDIATNNAKVTNATHTGEVTGATALTVDPTAITGKGAATVANGDLVLISDIDDSNNLKQVTAQSIGNLGGGGSPITVQDEGTPLTTAVTLFNFAGAGVTVTEPVGDQVLVTIPGGGGGATLDHDVNQGTHGFSVNDWIYLNGTVYTLADASAAATAESVGIVSAVAGVDDFTVQFGGRITGLSGLTAGEAHFLSETAGLITATVPVTIGAVIKPVLIADSTTSGFIFNMRGNEITADDVRTDILSFTNATLAAGVLTHTHSLSQQYVLVQVFDENNQLVQPDNITLTSSSVATIDLSSFGTISGTWRSIVHN